MTGPETSAEEIEVPDAEPEDVELEPVDPALAASAMTGTIEEEG